MKVKMNDFEYLSIEIRKKEIQLKEQKMTSSGCHIDTLQKHHELRMKLRKLTDLAIRASTPP